MTTSDILRYTRIPTHGSGSIPAAGFGTLIPDPLVTKQAIKAALEAGFRHLDCAERYRNEAAVGEAIQEAFTAGTLLRETCSLPQSCGTPIIVQSGSSLPSKRAAGDCNLTISIAISSIRPLLFDPATIRTRGISAVR